MRGPFRKVSAGNKDRPTKAVHNLPANDLKSLHARKDARQKLDVEGTSLRVRQRTTRGHYERDFYSCVELYPHHEYLLRQLLAGAAKDLGQRLVAYQTHQDAYLGIEEFLCYLNGDEPLHKAVNCIADIDFQVANGFRSWLIRKFRGRVANRKRYGRVREAITLLQSKHSSNADVGCSFRWPPGPQTSDKPSESYSTGVFNALANACLVDIKEIMATMSRFDVIAARETPLRQVEHSLENLMYELVTAECSKRDSGQIKPTHRKGFEWIIRHHVGAQNYAREHGMTMSEFVELYRSRGRQLAKEGRPIHGGRVSRHGLVDGHDRQTSARIALATVASRYPYWPLYMDLETADRLLSQEWHLEHWDRDSIDTRLYRALGSIKVGRPEAPIEKGKMACYSHFCFTFNTIFPFLLFVQLNTGWNLESVLSLTDRLDDHVEPDLIHEDYVIIYGNKQRSKSAVSHRSNRKSRYSVYSILRFVEAQVVRHMTSPHYEPGRLWQAILSKNLWRKWQRMISPLESRSYPAVSTAFLVRHGIVVDPTKKVQALEARRIRTTYATMRREQGLPIEAVSSLLDHGDVDTTDRHYDSDLGATDLKNKRLRQLQARYVADIQHYSARLAVSTTLAQLRDAVAQTVAPRRREIVLRTGAEIGIDDMDRIIHLISPEGQTYIAACADSRHPTWPRARDFVPEGQLCRYFNRCCLCDQGVIFREALPYVLRRVKDLEALRLRMPAPAWNSNYGDELEAWEGILNAWRPQADITEARALVETGAVVLPLTMRGG